MQPNTKMSSGQATFDLKAAREICPRVKGYEDPDGGNFADFQAAEMLPVALGEIERLRAREKEFVLASSKKTHFALDTAKFWIDQYEGQAKRIAELEEENRQLVRQILTDDDKDRLIAKQRAALKKLGQEKRERGKALVEERAQWNAICRDVGADPSDRYCTGEGEDGYPDAREQLRLEGKL